MNKNILKKGVQIGVLGAALATGAVMGTGCAQPTGTTIENNGNTTPKNYATPTNVPLGSGYTIRKFVGEYDNIARDTVVDDVNHYFGKAESYIHGLTSGFSNPEKFQTLINSLQNTTNYNVNGYDGARNIDAVINAFRPCETIFEDIISNLGGYTGNAKKNYLEREAFEQCYRVLANEAYYEAYGTERNMVKDNYEYKKNQLIAGWSQEENQFLTANLINAYNKNNFDQITFNMDNLLKKPANKMGVTTADLRKVVNIALVGESLHAMHDLTSNPLQHKQETMLYNPILAMQHQMTTLKKAEQNQYQSMSLGL